MFFTNRNTSIVTCDQFIPQRSQSQGEGHQDVGAGLIGQQGATGSTSKKRSMMEQTKTTNKQNRNNQNAPGCSQIRHRGFIFTRRSTFVHQRRHPTGKLKIKRQTFFLTGRRNVGLYRWIDPIWFWLSLEKLSNTRRERSEIKGTKTGQGHKHGKTHVRIWIPDQYSQMSVSITTLSNTFGLIWNVGGAGGCQNECLRRF